jgi:type I restriction enzyme M protein
MSSDLREIDDRLWKTADQLRTNAGLKPSEYSWPVLGLLFLRSAEAKFVAAEKDLKPQSGSRRTIGPADYIAKGVIYLPPQARYSHLLALPEGVNLGKAINDGMKAIEDANEHLKDVLPRSYAALPGWVLVELLKVLDSLDMEGDAFGQVYEYFMGSFAMQTMQKGGEFYTPASLVKLIVEIIEPFHGKILDPACGSGGMFVHSAEFVRNHEKAPERELSIHGSELVRDNLRMAKMNLAVHGLAGDIREANTMYEDPFDATGGFDFVMANPPFNGKGVDKERLVNKADRFPFGAGTTDNSNYLWIQTFYSALNDRGRAGFVMANSAGDARGSEQVIRQKLVETGAVDVIISVGPNFFFTVTLPCTLWFFDKGKAGGKRAEDVLFIDARHIFRQVDRAHRDFLPAQIEFLANIVRLWRGEQPELIQGSFELLAETGLTKRYSDVLGLCKVATKAEIEAQGWSLNPGRYVGATARDDEDVNFSERLEELGEELEVLNAEARELEGRIAGNVALVLERAI